MKTHKLFPDKFELGDKIYAWDKVNEVKIVPESVEASIAKSVKLELYSIMHAEIAHVDKMNVLYLHLQAYHPQRDQNVFQTYPLIGESIYKPFMEEMNAKSPAQLEGRDVSVYIGENSSFILSGISRPHFK